jgi:hypothetical protein
MNIPEHSKPGGCLDCHNAHLGRNKLLLKKDYKEEKYPARLTQDAPGPKAPGTDKKGDQTQK